MPEPGEQEFLRSIFLMEGWDTVAAIEDGIGRLPSADAESCDELFVLTHRLKGAAALHGFHRIASIAKSIEQILGPVPAASIEVRRRAELTSGRLRKA